MSAMAKASSSLRMAISIRVNTEMEKSTAKANILGLLVCFMTASGSMVRRMGTATGKVTMETVS